MKILNKRSTSSPSLRGANAVCDVAIQRRCSCHPERSEGSRPLPVIPESLCRESAVRRSGFTLVELVIVIAIVIILSVVSVPIYRGYTREAKKAEGYALLGTMLSSQKAYYSRYGYFLRGYDSSGRHNDRYFTSNEEVLGIDARSNKYFTWFSVNTNGGNENVQAHMWVEIPEELCVGAKKYLRMNYNVTKGSSFAEQETVY